MENALSINDAQQSDFIWTWKSNARGAKVSVWLPYFSKVEKIPRSKLWCIAYNGGNLIVDLEQVDFFMFYGATGDLPLEFLDALSRHRIPLMVHRRNVVHPLVFHPANIGGDPDVLSKQILVREHAQKRIYVARTLIRHRLEQFRNVLPLQGTIFKELAQAKSIAEVRQIEAFATSKYWDRWFEALGVDGARRADGPIPTALNAGSKFLYGVLLRWILFHKLSPCHGFLHEPTGYPALAYDLMEPYRYLIEESAARAYRAKSGGKFTEAQLVAAALKELKFLLDEVVYVPATRQFVRRKNLLHGIVLALRAYLLNEAYRLVIPVEGAKKGGRPPKIGYRLPGETKENRNGGS